eukprot:Amastigsp_a7037_15.p4 type:complete len:133 gc:universal Amastigsp_a7037_15:834-1232(+)
MLFRNNRGRPHLPARVSQFKVCRAGARGPLRTSALRHRTGPWAAASVCAAVEGAAEQQRRRERSRARPPPRLEHGFDSPARERALDSPRPRTRRDARRRCSRCDPSPTRDDREPVSAHAAVGPRRCRDGARH